jgi:hypothetical protein
MMLVGPPTLLPTSSHWFCSWAWRKFTSWTVSWSCTICNSTSLILCWAVCAFTRHSSPLSCQAAAWDSALSARFSHPCRACCNVAISVHTCFSTSCTCVHCSASTCICARILRTVSLVCTSLAWSSSKMLYPASCYIIFIMGGSQEIRTRKIAAGNKL